MLNKMSLPLLSLAMLCAGTAHAESDSGWYFGLAAAHYQLNDARSTARVSASPSPSGALPASPGIVGGAPVVGSTPVGQAAGGPNTTQAGGSPAVNEDFDISFDNGKGFSLIAGYRGYAVGRLELELQYLSSTAEYNSETTGRFSADYETISLKGSVYRDFLEEGSIRPYVGGGLGVVQIDSTFDEDIVPQLELGLGARFAPRRKMTMDVGYRFFYSFDPSLEFGDATIDTEYWGHSLQIQLLWG